MLEERGLRVWLDEWELIPGQPWQEAIEDVIGKTRSAAVLIGHYGIGPWQTPEMRAVLSLFVKKGLPVIPVLLPDAPSSHDDLPLFLQSFTWVDCRAGFSIECIERLVWGITGIMPSEEATTKQAKCNPTSDTCPNAWNPPRSPTPFIGREKDIGQIKAALGMYPDAPDIQSKIISIHGLPGVGKSTLAAHLANDRDILQAFPDAVLWSAFGQLGSNSDRDFEIRARLRSWGSVLGDEYMHSSMQINEMSERLAIMLRNRKALLICDDVWDVNHISAIRRLADGDVRLLTTSRLTDVAENAVSYPDGVFELKVFEESDAIALLKIVAPEVAAKHPNEISSLVKDLEYLPLAINVAGQLLRREMKAGLGVISLITELRAEGEQLLQAAPPADMMELIQEAKSPTVAAWLKRSTQMLDADTLQCFISLGYIAPKPATFGLRLLKKQWKNQNVNAIIRRLFDAGLIQVTNDERYQMHALLVTLARSMRKEISKD